MSIKKSHPDKVRRQQNEYRDNISNLENQLSVVAQQISQKQRELTENQSRIANLQRSYNIALKEYNITKPLADEGVVPKIELLKLQRSLNDTKRDLTSARLQAPVAKSAIKEATFKYMDIALQFRSDIQSKLNDTSDQLSSMNETRIGLEDRVKRTTVVSPVTGTIQKIYVNTVGGVIQPGMNLIEIVPTEDTLLIEAKIAPQDIGFLRPGLKAIVKFTAYDFTSYGGLDGVVETISADTIQDKEGNSFYQVRVRTDKNSLTAPDGESLPIIPGMTASVDIITGKRSVLDYLLKPILKSSSFCFKRVNMKNNTLKKLAFTIGASLMTMPVMAQSLEQAVAETLASNPEIKSAFNEFMSRNSMIDAAKGDYLPSVDLRAGVGYNNYDNEFGTKGEYDPKQAEISIRQLLWDGSITWNNINRNQSETEAQRYQLLSDAQDKALKTAEVYLDVLRAEAVLKLSESNYKVHQHMYVDIKKRADAGIGSTADLAQVEGRLARSKTNLLAAQSNLNDKKTEFARTVGTFPDDLVTPEVDTNFIPTSLDDAMKIAQKNNPVMYVASNDIDAAEYQYKQAKGNFYPTFDIEASQEWGNELNGSRGDTDEFKAMLNMRYNLFNGGSDAAKSRQAAYQ